jgi:polysaccharide export outer membrane protein
MDNGTMIRTFDIRSKDVVNSEFYYIQPNDIIYVQPLGRQFLGLNSFGAVFAVVSTVISFSFMIYNFAK